ncbi:MAG: hypothetical protein LBD04_10485 [Synergistaceae bacterium]|jgi:VIT1/CCC1 family predicted Fe2+/Mn2+ transporter|nr:hypothetical protein [Synergistaceae bacterium]
MGEEQARLKALPHFQRAEANGAELCRCMASTISDERNGSLILGFAEDEAKHARIFRIDGRKDVSSFYAGGTYPLTAALLILPFLCLDQGSRALALTMGVAIAFAAVFNSYVSVLLERPFLKDFLEMSGLTLGVFVVSFLAGIWSSTPSGSGKRPDYSYRSAVNAA